MNRELLSKAVGDIDERYVAEAYRPAPEAASGSSERIVHMKVKRIVTFALAAVLVLALGISAYAGYSRVSGKEAAEKVALEQIEVWKQMGLISPDVHFEGKADQIVEIDGHTGSDYWYGRLFHHSYDVRWRHAGLDGDGAKYGGNVRVDTLSGKIAWIVLDACADENDVPVDEVETEASAAPGGGMTTETVYIYDNFDDILPADMTVDRFCTLLAEYWGFSGYRLADTVDAAYYDAHWDAVDGSTLMLDLPRSNPDNYYLTVFFEGDQEGAPMYIELTRFPGYVTLDLGTNHMVG
ncbi:MAG: hypothetical protein IJJ43_01225 [Oscillospiraceae bacterium]|nr:hypothetical protein [Oscillospiraceae bacterium]